MAFDIQRTQRSTSGQGSGSLANVDVSTGGRQAAQAIGQAGEALIGSAVILNRLQAENQFSEAKRQVQETLDLLADDFERNPDSETYDERFKEAMASMKQFTPTNNLAARAFSQTLRNTRVNGSKMVMESKLARERDLFYANRMAEIAQGQFGVARIKLQEGVRKGLIDSTSAQRMLNDITGSQQAFQQRAQIQQVTESALAQETEDDALDLVRREGLGRGWKNQDITFVEGLVRDDFNRAEAQEVEDEEKRVEETEAAMAVRMFAEKNKTRAAEVHEANLPRVERDALLGMIRQRDKDILEKRQAETTPWVRARYNIIKRDVTSGKLSAVKGIMQYIEIQDKLDPADHEANIDGLFKAEQASKDPANRRIQTLLAGRTKTLEDRIMAMASESIFDTQQHRNFMRNFANEALNDLNDQYAGITPADFNVKELDELVDELTNKYAISMEARSRAQEAQQLSQAKTFKEQVTAVQKQVSLLRRRGKTQEAKDVLDEAIKFGLALPDGSPAPTKDMKPVGGASMEDIKKKLR